MEKERERYREREREKERERATNDKKDWNRYTPLGEVKPPN